MATPKLVAAPPRVSPSTTQDFHNISLTTKKHRRDLRSSKTKTSPKPSPLNSSSSTSKYNPHLIPRLLDNNDAAFTTLYITVKLQHLVQQEINRDYNLKTNAVPDATSGKIIE